MGNCCKKSSAESAELTEKLTPEELERRRVFQAKAAEERSKSFHQGGGGEKLKAKSKALENAEKKNREMGGSNITAASFN